MENRNYTVVQWTPSKIKGSVAQGSRSEKFHLNKDGIKGGGVAHVRKFLRSEHIYVPATPAELRPAETGADHPGLHRAIDLCFQQNVAATVEHPDGISLSDPPGVGIGRVQLQKSGFVLHLLDGGLVGKAGV